MPCPEGTLFTLCVGAGGGTGGADFLKGFLILKGPKDTRRSKGWTIGFSGSNWINNQH